MIDHGARDHAVWSASATERNVACPGAIALSALAPKQSSIYADTGTAVHQISERCIRSGEDANVYLGTVEDAKTRKIEIDEELVESAQTYIDYARSQIARSEQQDGRFWLEEKFSLAAIDPPMEAGGTGDLVIYFPADKLLEIADLKNGRGVVEAKGNQQLRTYALGAMLHHRGLDVERVKVTIVQPRAPHKDGRIRSETFHVVDLMEWTADLLTAMRRSAEASKAYRSVTGGVSMDEWADRYLTPGNCKWCPAEGFCPKLKRRAQELVGLWFDDRDQPHIGNTPADMSPEEVGRTLDWLPMLESYATAVRALGHTLAENGTPPTGYQLADKHGRRSWAADEAKVASDLLTVVGLSDDEIYDRKLRSPAQIEKALGSKRKKEIENMWHTPVTGTNLVSVAKTTRPPAQSTAERYFEPQN